MKKKFTRKPKEEKKVSHIIFHDEVYHKPSGEELYKKSFLYWKSWHQELLDALDGTNKKKYLLCARESLINLEKMKMELPGEYSIKIEEYIDEFKTFIAYLDTAITMTEVNRKFYRNKFERMLLHMRKEFHPSKVKFIINEKES